MRVLQAAERPVFDPLVAHPARVGNYLMGGKAHFAADREAAWQVMQARPEMVAGLLANREFLGRVVRYLVSRGIRQFLDIGTGLPAPGNTHQVAQRAVPGSRVVYVDNDPIVLAHARGLLTSSAEGFCDYLEADLRDVGLILRETARTLDLGQPVALLLLEVLPSVPDDGDPAGAVAALARHLAPGSYLAISHLTADFVPGVVAAAARQHSERPAAPVTARTHAQVTDLFGGYPLVAPGVVPVSTWRPDRCDHFGQPAVAYGGVARTVRRLWQPWWVADVA